MKYIKQNILFILISLGWLYFLVVKMLLDFQYPLPLFEYFSWDEFRLLNGIFEFQRMLSDNPLAFFFKNGESLGWGSLFWQIYSLYALPFRDFYQNDSGAILFYLRQLSLMFQILCLYLTCKILKKLHHNNFLPFLFSLLFIASMSGLQIVYRIFGFDYFYTFLLLCTTLFFVSYYQNPTRALFLATSYFFGLSLGTKIFTFFIFPLAIFMLLIEKLENKKNKIYQIMGKMFLFISFGFICSNSYLLSGKDGFNEFLSKMSVRGQEASFFKFPSFTDWFYHKSNSSPDTNLFFLSLETPGIAVEFFSPLILILLIFFLLYFLITYRTKWRELNYAGLIIGLCGLTFFFCTIFITKGVLTSYLIPSIFLLTIGLGSIIFYLNKNKNKYLIPTLSILMCFHFYCTLPGWSRKEKDFNEVRFSSSNEYREQYYNHCIQKIKYDLRIIPNSQIIRSYGTPVLSHYDDHNTQCYNLNSNMENCLKDDSRYFFSIDSPSPETEKILFEKGFLKVSCGETFSYYKKQS